MNSFLDSKFMQIVDFLVDMVILSLLWALCTLPVVTVGASSASLFHVVQKRMANKGGGVVSDYFHAFRDNLKLALPIGAVLTCAALVNAYVWSVSFNAGNDVWIVPMAMSTVAGIVLLCIQIYIYPLIGHFVLDIKQIITLAVVFMFRHPLKSLYLLLLLFTAIFAAVAYPPLIMILPAAYTFLSGRTLMRLFGIYIHLNEEETEDVLC